ncbi:MAG: cadherin domain-containing protein, partial [Verrucomicrobia bacterium]|nr:cadherin domain-containing protein [Verrucomicrobiota bacterium]
SGAAYVFTRSGTTWTQQAYLKASNTGELDYFGYSVAVSGDTVVVGAYWEDSNATGVNGTQADNSAAESGAAYIFTVSANAAPTDIGLSSTNVMENAASGTLVGTFTALDVDAGDTAAFSFVTGLASTDNGSFTISNGTNLVTADVFDYEIKTNYSIRVRATDSGGLSFEKQFTISVTDVPEWQPQRLALPEALAGGGLGLTFSNVAGGPIYSNESGLYAVEMSTNLALTNWQSLTNGLSLSNGVLRLDDADATNSPARFYRVIRK